MNRIFVQKLNSSEFGGSNILGSFQSAICFEISVPRKAHKLETEWAGVDLSKRERISGICMKFVGSATNKLKEIEIPTPYHLLSLLVGPFRSQSIAALPSNRRHPPFYPLHFPTQCLTTKCFRVRKHRKHRRRKWQYSELENFKKPCYAQEANWFCLKWKTLWKWLMNMPHFTFASITWLTYYLLVFHFSL